MKKWSIGKAKRNSKDTKIDIAMKMQWVEVDYDKPKPSLKVSIGNQFPLFTPMKR